MRGGPQKPLKTARVTAFASRPSLCISAQACSYRLQGSPFICLHVVPCLLQGTSTTLSMLPACPYACHGPPSSKDRSHPSMTETKAFTIVPYVTAEPLIRYSFILASVACERQDCHNATLAFSLPYKFSSSLVLLQFSSTGSI